MNYGLSDQVRMVALTKYVQPAIRSGKTRISVAARDLMDELRLRGFPDKNWHQICSAIQAEKFLRANGLEIEGIEGPPSKTSSTVVVHYRIASQTATPAMETARADAEAATLSEETPSARAFRLTERLRGLLKEEIATYGGTEGFIRWVRGYDEDEDAA